MPTELGQPCWDVSNIPRAITSTAKVDAAQKDYFLACHTPIVGITNDNTKEQYTEETFCDELFKESHGNVLSIVHGNPGTGKSHLIQWLKLRCEDKLERGDLKNYVAVLVQRRYGNLKDALEQIVEQLGGEFGKYIETVRAAVGNISETTARKKFADEFYYELSPEHRGEKIRGELEKLPLAFQSPGFSKWMCRDGGPIDQNVRRLTERSDIDERESMLFPEFKESDFEYQPRHGDQNVEGLFVLFDDLNDEPELRKRAAEMCNDVLPNVIRQRIGLTDNGLMEVFDRVRVDLKKQGKSIALFIEDISVMSALNEDVYAAVEPRAESRLCKMVAVLGVTDQGRQRLIDGLAENRRQRITHPVSVGQQGTDAWNASVQEVAKFSARYLNAIRLDPQQVSRLAEQKRNQEHLTLNACDGCAVRDRCHSVFGSEIVDGSQVGLFPFTREAPQILLSNLNEQVKDRKNPRGLLTEVLEKTLSRGHEQLTHGQFPHLTLAVDLPPATYWRAFEQAYCAGWSNEYKKRIKFLAEAWINAKNEKEAANELSRFLAPLHFRQFSKAVEISSPKLPPKVTPAEDSPSHPELEREDPRLKSLLGNIQKWREGDSLYGDADVRNLLKDLFNNSFPWDDEVKPPLNERKKLVHDSQSAGSKPYDIEGMRLRPGGTNLKFQFKRNADSATLFEALGQFEILGRKSWRFHGSEVFKRDIFKWIRNNAHSYMQELEPQAPLEPELPIRTAVQLLALIATVRRSAKLPIEPRRSDELVEEILKPSGNNERDAISQTWKTLLEDLGQRGPKLKDFVISEIMVPQGRSGGGNFIDPIPIVDFARDFADNPQIDQLDDAYFAGHLKSRYECLRGANAYSDLTTVLEAERSAIKDVADEISFELRALGIASDDLRESVAEFCKMSIALSTAVVESNLYISGVDAFQQFIKAGAFTNRCDVWITAARSASEIADSDSVEKVLTFVPNNLLELKEAVFATSFYVGRVGLEAEKIIDDIVSDGDPDDYLKAVKDSLEQIKKLDLVG